MSDGKVPLVSVVVTFYNQASFVPRALGSVLNQTYANLDIIVIDDGSPDHVADEVKKIADNRVRFFALENGGVSRARNTGVKNAKGDFIAFLDGDDAFLSEKVSHCINMAKERGFPKAAFVTGYYVVSRMGWIVGQRTPLTRQLGDDGDNKPCPDMRPSVCVYHKDIFVETGGFPEDLRINEDGVFSQNVSRRYEVVISEKPFTLYLEDGTGKCLTILHSFESVMTCYLDRLATLNEVLNSSEMKAYERNNLINNFYGFFSVGNLKGAALWYKYLLEKDVLGRGIKWHVALFSLQTKINIYNILHVIDRYLSLLKFIRETWAQRTNLQVWKRSAIMYHSSKT